MLLTQECAMHKIAAKKSGHRDFAKMPLRPLSSGVEHALKLATLALSAGFHEPDASIRVGKSRPSIRLRLIEPKQDDSRVFHSSWRCHSSSFRIAAKAATTRRRKGSSFMSASKRQSHRHLQAVPQVNLTFEEAAHLLRMLHAGQRASQELAELRARTTPSFRPVAQVAAELEAADRAEVDHV